MTAPLPREAARAVLLEPGDQVMVLRYDCYATYDEDGGFRATPGGAREADEIYPEAVARELREERGIRHTTLGPHLASRVIEHLVAGRQFARQRYYLARILAEAVQPGFAIQPDNIRESRWWTLAELASTRQTGSPAGLSALFRAVLTSGPPEKPVVLV